MERLVQRMEFLFNWVDIHVLEIDCQSFPSLYAILSYRRPQRTVSQATINNWNLLEKLLIVKWTRNLGLSLKQTGWVSAKLGLLVT